MHYSQSIESVSFVLSSLKFGGGERVALNLAHAFKEMGLRIEFVLMSYEGEYLNEAMEHFSVVNLSCDRSYKLPSKLSSYLRKQKPDVLISSFWKLNLCACLARVFYPRVNLLLWEHSPPSLSANSPTWLYALTASTIYRLANQVIAVSNGVRDDILRITIGLNSRLKVIFNPIPPPVHIRLNQSKKVSEYRILWVGRLDHPKNPELMLEAFYRLPVNACYTLDFIGDGALRAKLEARCKDLCLQNKVSFHGYQPNPYHWMSNSDLLVLTSDREGLPTVLIEALYCGLPIVSTDCGAGIHDILDNQQYGTIVPKQDAEALALAILKISKDQNDSNRQIAAAQRFKPNLIAKQFIEQLGLSIKYK